MIKHHSNREQTLVFKFEINYYVAEMYTLSFLRTYHLRANSSATANEEDQLNLINSFLDKKKIKNKCPCFS